MRSSPKARAPSPDKKTILALQNIDDVLVDRLKEKGISFATISNRFDKASMRELIQRHNEAAEEFKRLVEESTPETMFNYRVVDPLTPSPSMYKLKRVDSMFRLIPPDQPIDYQSSEEDEIRPLKLFRTLIRGKFCAKPFMTGGVRTVFEDLTENVVLVVIDNAMCSTASEQDVCRKYPEGMEVAIKQPELKPLWKDGTVGWRISNPADIVPVGEYNLLNEGRTCIPHCSDGIPLGLHESCYRTMTEAAEQLLVQGDLLYSQGEGSRAAACYNVSALIMEGIPTDQAPSFGIKEKLQLLYAKDIKACMLFGGYKRALRNADRWLELTQNGTVHLMKKLRILYAMEEHERARDCLNELRIQGKGSDLLHNVDKVMTGKINTAYEQSCLGIFTFPEDFMKDSCESKETLECHQYIGPVEIRDTRNGRGVVATRDVKPGELLVVSKALARSEGAPKGDRRPGLYYYGLSSGKLQAWSSQEQDVLVQMIQKAQESAQYARQLRSLRSSSDSKRSIPPLSLFTQAWDEGEEDELWNMTDPEWREVHLSSINVRNIRGTQRVNGFRNALYGLASFFNHSCSPNSVQYKVGDHVFVSSSRGVKAGEEFFLHYYSTFRTVIHRRECPEHFVCHCPRCDFEEQALITIPALNTLAKRYHGFFENQDNLVQTATILSEAAKIAAKLDRILSSDDCKHFTQKEQDWIRCSLAQIYVFPCVYGMTRNDLSTADETLRILAAVDPCSPMLLTVLGLSYCVEGEKSAGGDHFKRLLQEKSENFYLPVAEDKRFEAMRNWTESCALSNWTEIF